MSIMDIPFLMNSAFNAQSGVKDLTSPSGTSMQPGMMQSGMMQSGTGSSTQAMLQDIENLLQNLTAGQGMPGMQTPGATGGMMPSPMMNMASGIQMPGATSPMMPPPMMQPPMIPSPMMGTYGGTSSMMSPSGGGAPVGTPMATASNPTAGSGPSGTTPVNLNLPGQSNPVKLLESQPDATGAKQLYATDGSHRGSISANGTVTFDNYNAAKWVVGNSGMMEGLAKNNGSGGYTLSSGQLTDGNLPGVS